MPMSRARGSSESRASASGLPDKRRPRTAMAVNPTATSDKRQNLGVHIPAKVDYGLRALLALTATGAPLTADSLAAEQGLPPRFLGAILADLRRAGLVASQRGSEGGYRLGREPEKITFAEVIRALDGPLANIRGLRPEDTSYEGAAEHLQDVWVALRASLRGVLEHVTLADVARGRLPKQVLNLTSNPDAWEPH